MTQPLVLSLFPGIGLLDMAFELEGFCVVRGPDLLWGGDIRTFHPPAGKFDGVIGGPPCQLFSVLKRLNPRAGEKHGNLIPEFERCAREARPAWFLMENVVAAPQPAVVGYSVWTEVVFDAEVGGQTQRVRRFVFGSLGRKQRIFVERRALYSAGFPAVCSDARVRPVALGGSRKRKPGVSRVSPGNGPRLAVREMLSRQGASPDFFDESPFTETAKRKLVGNGVPLPMGRAIAKAVRQAMYAEAVAV